MSKTNTAATYLLALEKVFSKAGNVLRAQGAAQYMRNQFEYFGIQTDERRRIGKQFIKTNPAPEGTELETLIRLLWKQDKREYQYFGMELLQSRIKQGEKVRVNLIEYMIQHKSWWDTVDFIAPTIAGGLLMNEPELLERTAVKWMKSDNLWLKRSAILIQLKYKKRTNNRLLFSMILKSANETDFFIRKAIGWSLRQYGKTNPEGVKDFVHDNEASLSGLSKREALRIINKS
ncbi:MAG: DNA alkylation repair protein [Bacteroidia bacterium]